ncbi:MAG: hypothetical protein ACYS4W_10795 [Planctomycetota bacterium]
MDSKSVKEYAKEIIGTASKHNCKRFLNDMREAQLDLSTIEIYEIPGFLDAAGLDRTSKRALVVSRQPEDYRFFENVSINRGYNVKVFEDMDEAMNWLRADAS